MPPLLDMSLVVPGLRASGYESAPVSAHTLVHHNMRSCMIDWNRLVAKMKFPLYYEVHYFILISDDIV